jgi:hypothetical protein
MHAAQVELRKLESIRDEFSGLARATHPAPIVSVPRMERISNVSKPILFAFAALIRTR